MLDADSIIHMNTQAQTHYMHTYIHAAERQFSLPQTKVDNLLFLKHLSIHVCHLLLNVSITFLLLLLLDITETAAKSSTVSHAAAT